jgi:hypothetical protein
MNFLLTPLLRPLRYLDPGTGSIIIQVIAAALGGGLFFLFRAKWNDWFRKGKKKEKKADGIEEEIDEKPTTEKGVKKAATSQKSGKTEGKAKATALKAKPSASKKMVEKETVKKPKRIK